MMARRISDPTRGREHDSETEPSTLEPVASGDDKPARTVGKSATQEKLDWLDDVASDHHRVNPTAFKVAYAVAQHLNTRTREAWPSQDRLAKLVGVSETTLRASLRTLIGLGHLQQAKRGVRNANKYRLGRSTGGADDA